MIARRNSLPIGVLLGLCGGLLLFSRYGDYTGVNGQDAHDHWRLAQAWMEWWGGGQRPLMAEHPHGYPFLGALVGLSGVGALWGLRLVSLGAYISLLLVLRGILVNMHGADLRRSIDGFLLIAAATAPFLLRYAATVMSDVTAMALLMGAFLLLLRWLDHGRWPDSLGCVLLGAWALWVRMAVAPVLMVAGAALVVGPSVGRKSRIHWGAALIVALGLVILFFGVTEAVNGRLWVPLADWSPLNMLSRVHRSDDGELRYFIPNLLYVGKVFVHPGFLLIGPLLMAFVRWEDLRHRMSKWVMAALFSYLCFIACMPFQNDRVLLLALPFVVLLLFPAYMRLEQWMERRRVPRSMWLWPLLLAQLVLTGRALWPFMRQAQVERELAAVVGGSGAEQVYTHGMGAALSNYCPNKEVIELWYGELEHMKSGALLVVRPGDLETQWQGLAPAQNWAIAQRHGMDTVIVHPAGWLVARLH
ncbi:MAG: hypothetical protein R2817_08155 [Flavobacteriales bacterium]